MAFTDKTLTCVECGSSFTFPASEQELFASRGYTNEPKRCSTCRETRRAERGGSSGNSNFRGGTGRREMFPATCARCGQQTQVPFEPRGTRPVYCSDCFAKERANSSGSYR